MATVPVTSEVNLNFDQLLSRVAQLDTDELRNCVDRVSLMLAQRKAASLPELEANLLQAINRLCLGNTLPQMGRANKSPYWLTVSKITTYIVKSLNSNHYVEYCFAR